MKLVELCEPLFQNICRLNRLARSGADLPASQIRSEIKSILEQMRTTAAETPGLLAKYEMTEGRDGKRGIELVMIFFADSMIRDSKLECARGWDDIAAEYDEYAGDDKFFDLLDEALEDRSSEATEQLAVYYTCLGLGFVGGLFGQPEAIRRKMHDCVARIGDTMDDASRGRICREAYDYTDRRPLNVPRAQKIMTRVGLLVAIFITVFVAAGVGYHQAQKRLSDSLETIQTNLQGHQSGESSQ